MSRFTQRPTFNLFAIPFGLAGLSGALDVLGGRYPAVGLAGSAVWVLSAVAFVALSVSYVAQTRWAVLVDDLRHPTLGPFAALAPLVMLMLVTHFLLHVDHALAIATAGVALVISVALAGWFAARWMLGGGTLERVHPGYLLPTVAATLVSAVCFARLGLPAVAYALTGIGVLFWLVITALFVTRGFAGFADLGSLAPTLAIHAAPAPVLGILWFSLGSPGGADAGFVLLGLTAFGVVIQLFLMPRFARLAFAPSFWSFTFSTAAVASFWALWVDYTDLPVVLAVLPVAAVAALIAAIGLRHLFDPVVLRRRGAASTARPRSVRAASPAPQ